MFNAPPSTHWTHIGVAAAKVIQRLSGEVGTGATVSCMVPSPSRPTESLQAIAFTAAHMNVRCASIDWPRKVRPSLSPSRETGLLLKERTADVAPTTGCTALVAPAAGGLAVSSRRDFVGALVIVRPNGWKAWLW